jgi:hypothetical protein
MLKPAIADKAAPLFTKERLLIRGFMAVAFALLGEIESRMRGDSFLKVLNIVPD